MKTRIGYVERLTDKLVGYKGVIFEDHPDRVYIENPPIGYATSVIDGVTFAAFPKYCDKYKDLHDPRPDLEIGDIVITAGGYEGVITQITLGKHAKTSWFVSLDNGAIRYDVSGVKKVEPKIGKLDINGTFDFPERVYATKPMQIQVTNEGISVTEAPQNVTVTIKADDLAELELLSRTLSEAITDVLDKERELRHAKETLAKFMEELER